MPLQLNTKTAMLMALLMVVGGVIGFIEKGSKASLIAGISFGVIYAILAYAMQQQPSYSSKYNPVAAGVSAVLTVVMGVRAVGSDFATAPTVIASLGAVSAVTFMLL
jgi:uncharacterized membrane protein (UPF0136 family)